LVRTPLVLHAATVMTVGVDEDVADACEEAVEPLPVVRVAHLAAATERVLTLRPVLVVVPARRMADASPDLVERADAVGARIVSLDGLRGGPLLDSKLRAALRGDERG